MFSLTTRTVALPGQRDTVAEILLKGSMDVPGCLRYVTDNDSRDESSVWINEVWQCEASYRSALSLPHVKQATTAALRMIVGVGDGE